MWKVNLTLSGVHIDLLVHQQKQVNADKLLIGKWFLPLYICVQGLIVQDAIDASVLNFLIVKFSLGLPVITQELYLSS